MHGAAFVLRNKSSNRRNGGSFSFLTVFRPIRGRNMRYKPRRYKYEQFVKSITHLVTLIQIDGDGLCPVLALAPCRVPRALYPEYRHESIYRDRFLFPVALVPWIGVDQTFYRDPIHALDDRQSTNKNLIQTYNKRT